MSINVLSLPVDIPWRRIAATISMHAIVGEDMPSKWAPSITIFSYEPPLDQQSIVPVSPDEVTTYLKVVCTITGHQFAGEEIDKNLFRGLRFSGAGTGNKVLENYQNLKDNYAPALGALVQVVVAPDEGEWDVEQYPYFSDFEPKKRELIELVTETGETLTQSANNLNVRKGSTTTESLEKNHVDKSGQSFGIVKGQEVNLGNVNKESLNVSYGRTSGSEDSTKSSSSSNDVYMTTTDASTEKRESYSHSTNLTQLYHQLDSYHVGTNRAVFFINSRPHTVQSPYTFVRGPREIEGIQEFFLVVRRPKDMNGICVEAQLETAHLYTKTTETPIAADYGEPLAIPKVFEQHLEGDFESGSGDIIGDIQIPNGYRLHIENTNGGGSQIYGWGHTEPGTPGVAWHDEIGGDGMTSDLVYLVYPHFTVHSDRVHVEAHSVCPPHKEVKRKLTVTIYCIKEQPITPATVKKDTTTTFYLTGRRVSSCGHFITGKEERLKEYVSYERTFNQKAIGILLGSHGVGADVVRNANQFSRILQSEVYKSFRSGERYPIGQIDFVRTKFARQALLDGLDRESRMQLLAPLADVIPEHFLPHLKRASELSVLDLILHPAPTLMEHLGGSIGSINSLLNEVFPPSSQEHTKLTLTSSTNPAKFKC